MGYLAAWFAETTRGAEWRANHEQTLADLKALGVTIEPFGLPKMRSSVRCYRPRAETVPPVVNGCGGAVPAMF